MHVDEVGVPSGPASEATLHVVPAHEIHSHTANPAAMLISQALDLQHHS
jgi:hypothetical protein